jgi:plastocyanin
MLRTMAKPIFAILLAAVLPAALRAATVTVQVGAGGTVFSPATATVIVGDTIHWVWAGSPHSTTSGTCSGFTCTPDGTWDSGVQNTGFTFDHTFATKGLFHYYCLVHGSMMTGTIIVVPPTQLSTVTPCRIIDTRALAGPTGGPALGNGATRDFLLAGHCGIPAGATAVAVNIAVTQPTNGPGFLTLYPAGTARPLFAAINYAAGQTRANNAILPLGALGDISVYCAQGGGTVHFILDVTGYFQ